MADGCGGSLSAMAHRKSAVLVFGMTRSGTSLTTSTVAAMMNRGEASWRGSGPAYPTDRRNRFGYFERADVVSLNYQALRSVVGSWTTFAPDFAAQPRTLNWSSARAHQASFESRARPIVLDMAKHVPFVLKDVRFSRTLPLWEPLLLERGLDVACVLPFRNPLEVERSSVTGGDRLVLWTHYMLSALATARSVCGVERTHLVHYESWLHPAPARKQSEALATFLACAGVPVIPNAAAAARALVRPSEKHFNGSAPSRVGRPMPRRTACLYDELRSGRALHWPAWDARHRRFTTTPCAS